jgi:2-oxoglutarate ferredoxin oxidoreductase subunit alpha
MAIDFTFKIGGEAGQGLQSIGYVLSKAFSKGGLYVFVNQDYESRIRGGHIFVQVRVSDEPVYALSEEVKMLIPLNKETIDLHKDELTEGGAIVFDGEKIPIETKEPIYYSIPLERLAVEKGGNRIMINSVASGAAMGLLDYDFGFLATALTDEFGRKGKAILDSNINAAKAGYDYAKENFRGRYRYAIKPIGSSSPKKMVLNGDEAIATGAIAAGCKFMAGYPMTPTSPILEFFASKAKEYNLVFVQSEDELAAMNMVVGAGYAGVRAMTATSGDGFALMIEGLGQAGMTETPIVAVEGQRPGPAVGLPTRTSQSDLLFVIRAGNDEFPRAVFTPGTEEEAFWLTIKAFNIAEKYQIPVIILIDQHLADSYRTIERFDLSKVKIERGEILSEEQIKSMGLYEYKRHEITESGVSPRAIPGTPGCIVVTDADEHGEEGHIVEDGETRTKMVLKRLRKFEGVKKEMEPPEIYGSRDAKITLIGWGSTYGAIREAVDILRKEGTDANMLHLNVVWPFPKVEVSKALDKAEMSFVIENNAIGQLAYLIKSETGKDVNWKILKFDGRPFSPMHIVREVRSKVKG